MFATILGLTIAVLLNPTEVFAQLMEVRENYNGARSLAMGGASIAVVNDETALFHNPAALGRLRDMYGTIIDPEMDGTSNLNNIYTSKALSNPFDLEQVRDTLNVSRDTHFHARGQLSPSFVVKNFGIGALARKTMDARMSPNGASMPTFYQDDVAVHLGVNLRLFDGRVKIGLLGKAISRIEIDKDIDPTGTMALDQHANEGFGIGGDAGIILTAPVAMLPTISAVVRDVGGTAYTAGSGLRMKSQTGVAPTKTEQDVDVALAFFPIHSNRSRSVITFEYQKMKAAGLATDKSRYYHAGYEFNYADALFIRAGMNQKYWTAGVELASERTQFQITSYGEDVGTDGNSIEDRRYVFKFAFRF